MNPSVLAVITYSCTAIALIPGLAINTPVRVLGFFSGAAACVLLYPDEQAQRKNESAAQQDLINQKAGLEQQAAILRAEIGQLRQQASSDIEAQKAAAVSDLEALNSQIADLQSLIDEEFLRIEEEEQSSKARLQQQLEQWEAQKREQLEAIASEDEARLADAQKRAEEELESDKQQFLQQQKKKESKLLARIEELEAELSSAHTQLSEYEGPQYADGCEQEQLAARRCQEILHQHGVIADFRGAWVQDGFLLVKLRPRTGGEEVIRGTRNRHIERMRIELKLSEMPQLAKAPGGVLLYLRPRALEPIPVDPIVVTPTIQNMQPQDLQAVVSQLEITALDLGEFQPPQNRFQPVGPIAIDERRWVLWLWLRCGLHNQNKVIAHVWCNPLSKPVLPGSNESYHLARGRLHQILDDAGIHRKGNDDEDG